MPGTTSSERDRVLSRALIAGLLLALAALILFAWLVDSVLEGETKQFDQYVRDLVHSRATPHFTAAMRFFSLLGSPAVLGTLATATFLIFWRSGWRRPAFLLAIALVGGVLLDQTLKLVFRRVRPPAYFDYPLPNSYSFPSGHALLSFCFFGVVASLVSARMRTTAQRVILWMVATILIALIGFSRIYLGVHYSTDVLGGYMAAFVWITAVSFADRWHQRRRARS